MKKTVCIFCILFLLLLLSGCRSHRHLPGTVNRQDSVNVRVETHTEYVTDTVFVEIPAQTAERATRDTVSHLETSYAVSDARLMADGTLYHSLSNKAGKRPYETQKAVVYRDSIVYRDRVVTETKTVKVPREMTWWQKTQIRGFWAAIILLAVVCRKKILSLIL